MTPKELALQALENMRGDNLYRAQRLFRRMSSEELEKEYGNSGKTPKQILLGYQAHENQVNEAIRWVRTQAD